MDPYSSDQPYFFEKYFPASYHIAFQPPLHRHPGSFGVKPEDVDRRSSISKDTFEVFVNVKDFKAEEITVKTVNDMVIVAGKQGKRDNNAIPRHFEKHFRLPPFFDSEDVYSIISDDGILEIKAEPTSRKKMKHLDECKALDTVNKD